MPTIMFMSGDTKPSRLDFERLALAQLDTLYRVARRLAGDAGSAEDLVQETYLRALRAADGFKLEEFGIRPWLLRIMQNLFVTRSQRESKQPRRMDDQQLAAISDPNNARSANTALTGAMDSSDPALAEGSALFDSMDDQMVTALDQLPGEYQQVMLLWAVEDLSYKEIAQALDVPIGTVISRLHRARQRLAELLRGYAREQGLIRE